MAKLCRSPRLAEELFGFLGSQPIAARYFHGHCTVEFNVAGLPHSPERAGPDLLDQLEVPEHSPVAEIGRGLLPDQIESAAAGRAHQAAEVAIIRDFRRLLAMETAHMHYRTILRWQRGATILASSAGNCKRVTGNGPHDLGARHISLGLNQGRRNSSQPPKSWFHGPENAWARRS